MARFPGRNTPAKNTGKSKEEKLESEKTPSELKEEILEQRRSSLRYFNSNYYEEWAEIYRNQHARTKPYEYYNRESGQYEEDTHGRSGRTNVCVPDHFVMMRRGTSRLTRNPPNLRVRGGPDNPEGQANRDKVSAHLMFQWDRSESQRAFKSVVSQSYGMGWGVGKVYYDEVPIIRRLRKLTQSLQPQDFKNLANANDPRIAAMVKQLGPRLQDPTPFAPHEQNMLIENMGSEAQINQMAMKYRGPVLANVFNGDCFPEPGFRSLQESGFVIENSNRDIDWLKYWTKQTSINPITGESKKVMSEKQCDKVMEKAGSRSFVDEQELSLRRRMREEIEMADPVTSGKPIRAPRKRVMIDERHAIIDGHLCIDFVGEESVYLGRLWYPWETYGKYTFCEMVMVPDWLGGVGMSTLMVTRFLLKLRNVRLNQTTDFINNILLPMLKVRKGADLTAYDMVRTGWGRLLELDNLADVEGALQDPHFPGEAWEDQAQYKQDMQQVDPSTVDFAPGTENAPGPGKFATTAKLADKAADNVTADHLDQVGMFVRDVVELELAMNQQAMNEPEDVPKTYFERIDAESIRNAGGNARIIKIDPMNYQEVYEVLPEQGSTLAADDEFRVAGLQGMIMIGERHPDIVDMRKAISALARATPGVNAEDIILPPPPPTPPEPPVKLNISVAIKWPDLPADVQAAILQREGLPVELTHVEGVAQVIGKVREAADHAAELEQPVHQSPPPADPNMKPPPKKAKPNGSAKHV